jgi:hypothetical protein
VRQRIAFEIFVGESVVRESNDLTAISEPCVEFVIASIGGDDSQGNLLDWADKLYGQSINAVTKGVKSMLSGGRQLAVAAAVEALMANQPTTETEQFAYFDPKVPNP